MSERSPAPLPRRTSVAVLLAAVLAAGCAGVRAQSDFDPNARFESYRTFAWLNAEPGSLPREGAPEAGATAIHVDPLLKRRIAEAIETQLGARGFRRVADRDSADFVVTFTVGARDKVEVYSDPVVYGGYGGRYGGWYSGSNVSARTYTEGTLAVDIFDGKSHQAVWHGWATKRVSESTNREQIVDQVVTAIMKKFPPPR